MARFVFDLEIWGKHSIPEDRRDRVGNLLVELRSSKGNTCSQIASYLARTCTFPLLPTYVEVSGPGLVQKEPASISTQAVALAAQKLQPHFYGGQLSSASASQGPVSSSCGSLGIRFRTVLLSVDAATTQPSPAPAYPSPPHHPTSNEAVRIFGTAEVGKQLHQASNSECCEPGRIG